MEDDEEGVERTHVDNVAVHAGQDKSIRLNNADDKTEGILSALAKFFYLLDAVSTSMIMAPRRSRMIKPEVSQGADNGGGGREWMRPEAREG